jgi:hypothetical protein
MKNTYHTSFILNISPEISYTHHSNFQPLINSPNSKQKPANPYTHTHTHTHITLQNEPQIERMFFFDSNPILGNFGLQKGISPQF